MDQSIRWRNDAETRDAVLGHPFPITQEMEENWYKRALDADSNHVHFAICLDKNDTAIGFAHLTKIDWISRVAYVGILIGDLDYRGKGVGKSILAELIEVARSTLNLRKLCAEIIGSNAASLHLFSEAGFTKEGSLKKQVFRAGMLQDLILVGLHL
jgi:RimJ/RimL family protein N-acetyltransferase